MRLRSPIIVTLGHVDHGKTTLLDCIRGTAVARKEPGQITQMVGCSFVPSSVIEAVCGELLQRYSVKLLVPGLLFIDTPGHEAFVTLRKRGGSIADLGILVIDLIEGMKPQTHESLDFLKYFHTPFVVAATKLDLLPGWHAVRDATFVESYERQRKEVQQELEKRVYALVNQLAERGVNAERFDRIERFEEQVAVVPVSGITGEGVPELLMLLTGLAQRFLKDKLRLAQQARGAVLEVKETVGLGTTVDVILYDGSVRVGDWLVVGGKEPLVTSVRALLIPPALRELRVEKQFERVKEVHAAAGIKVAAPNLERVIAGSPLRFVSKESEVERAKEEVQREVEEVSFFKELEGVVIKADTLGSLEALIKMLTDSGIPIRRAGVGKVDKEDVVEAQRVKDPLRRVILAFNVKATREAEELVQQYQICIFANNIIYRLLEAYQQWCYEFKEREATEKLSKVVRPCMLRMLGKQYVFRSSKPAIFGVEVLRGILRPGTKLKRRDGKLLGEVKRVESEGKALEEVRAGQRVAISMEGVVVGRHVGYEDMLLSWLEEQDVSVLKQFKERLSEEERQLLKEWGYLA